MSNRYKGGIISATPPTTTGGESGVASGSWTLEQQLQAQGAGNWPSQPLPPFIEDVFSTYLYTGNNSTQTITNGIDLSTKGGLVWTKSRNAISSTVNIDTTSGSLKYMGTSEEFGLQNNSSSQNITSFLTNGYSLGTDESGGYSLNASATTYVSWTFRKQLKFFDVVTYTGNGTIGLTVPHNLGSVPACIIIKRTDAAADWIVYHRSLGATKYLILNFSNAQGTSTNIFNDTEPTSTVFTVGDIGAVNASGGSYVAYVFAHDAGGFGLTGTDNVISCGTYTGNGSATGPVVTLGYEPQWLMIKRAVGGTGSWNIIDNMRGMPIASNDAALRPNLSNVEASVTFVNPTSTGFQITSTDSAVNTNTSTYIYVAIRRGPMKVPTSGTSVFAPVYATSQASPYTATTNFPVDLVISTATSSGYNRSVNDRLRGGTTTTNSYLLTQSSAAEASLGGSIGLGFQNNTALIDNSYWAGYGLNVIYWNFKRAPSFFDEVCYTDDGTGSLVVNHNLQAVPELAILKKRSAVGDWDVSYTNTYQFNLNTDASGAAGAFFPALTSTTFTAPGYAAGSQMVVYLFATCSGVSKVGTYTGNGTTQTINCGFTGGARFVLIKRINAVGSWYVYDTARGMTTLTDPYLLLNSTAAESATLGSVTTVSTGFALNSTILADINVSGGTYIFLAIA